MPAGLDLKYLLANPHLLRHFYKRQREKEEKERCPPVEEPPPVIELPLAERMTDAEKARITAYVREKAAEADRTCNKDFKEFKVLPRGEKNTFERKGIPIDFWDCVPDGDRGKQFSNAYCGQKSWSFGVVKFGGESNAKRLAESVVHRWDYFVTIWSLHDFADGYKFTDEEIASYREPDWMAGIVEQFPTGPQAKRIRDIRALKPVLR